MTQCTPGPWEVASMFVGPLHIRADNLTIAHVGHDDFDTCAANAHMMAAAPDLFEALKLMLSPGADDNAEEHARVVNIAFAALAKATGSAQSPAQTQRISGSNALTDQAENGNDE